MSFTYSGVDAVCEILIVGVPVMLTSPVMGKGTGLTMFTGADPGCGFCATARFAFVTIATKTSKPAAAINGTR